MRAFVALDLPEPAKDLIERLASAVPVGRPTSRETLHLTLAFLGEIGPTAVQSMADGLTGLDEPAPQLRLVGLEPLGGSSPSVLAVTVAADAGLVRLHDRVRAIARAAGLNLPRERWRPHVTLARFPHRLHPDQAARLAGFLSETGLITAPAFQARTVTLYHSTLAPQGARHDPLVTVTLQG